MRHVTAFIFALLLSAIAPTSRAETVRSDLPLWPGGSDNVWPQGFSSKDEIGFSSIIALGDWRLRDPDCEAQGDDCFTWLRIRIFSVIDGGYSVARARTRRGLDDAIGEAAAFVALPHRGREPAGLFALQIGYSAGSRYMLLKGEGKPLHKRFDVLKPACDDAGGAAWRRLGYRERRAAHTAFFATRYCVARSPDGLRRLAARAATQKPEWSMEFVGPEQKAGEGGPSAR